MSQTLLQKIKSKKALIGVIGLGYVGLPLVREFTRAGVRVLGFDVDESKVESLKAGKSYIEHIPSEVIGTMMKDGLFTATSDLRQLRKPDCILICVPTPLSKMREPDLSYVESTVGDIARTLRKDQLVVLESTTYPGTTAEVVLPILAQSGLEVGKDFFLAFSPEREDPGRQDYSTQTIPKVVGGHDPASLKAAVACYEIAIDTVVPVSSCAVAESTKILENTYRCVNIALVNELKVLFDRMGIDVWEVIRAAATKPFGFTPFFPGPGLGGHCIPIDPFYLSWKAREFGVPTRFIELAGEVNVSMPEWVVTKVMDALNDRSKALKGAKVLILGMSYKPDIDDDRESPSYTLWNLLAEKGARVDYHDPHIPAVKMTREHPQFAGIRSKPLTAASLAKYDCVLISTVHKAVDYKLVMKHAKLVVDTRNAMSGIRGGRGKIVRA
jgi:UDP-N-acetyl-D-glucosamine dehydrogenase